MGGGGRGWGMGVQYPEKKIEDYIVQLEDQGMEGERNVQ